MKIIWITNVPVATHREMLNMPLNQSGSWLEAAYSALQDNKDISLCLVSVYKGNDIIRKTHNNHVFYLLPCKSGLANYDPDDSNNQNNWKTIIDDFKPDIIQLWGTEFSHGLCALKVAKNIPSIVYMQGLMNQISRHAMAGITIGEVLRYTTIRDIIRRETFYDYAKRQMERASIEKQILAISKKVIVESDWCGDICQTIAVGCEVYRSKLPINKIFVDYNWSPDTMKPHSVFTVAGSNQIKGLNMILKAFGLVVKRYPDAILNIPGEDICVDNANRWKTRSYTYMLASLIKKLGLENNVNFVGKLKPSEMAAYMSSSNVFVLPSAIENHSSTLIEAMLVGAPCVASYVGGIPDYFRHNENGLMYRYDEYEHLAHHICRLFEDHKLAKMLSTNALDETRKSRIGLDITADLLQIYNNLIKTEWS